MSWLKKLFGGGGAEPAAPTREIEHAGFTIRAEPYKAEGGQYQVAGTVTKQVGGEVKEHRFIRADRFPSVEDALDFSLVKGRQLVDQEGERMFRDRPGQPPRTAS